VCLLPVVRLGVLRNRHHLVMIIVDRDFADAQHLQSRGAAPDHPET
jgi:hypothetical protein